MRSTYGMSASTQGAVLNDPDEIVVVITAPTIAVEAAEEVEAAAFEPEIIEKGKKEEEDF